MDAWFRKRDQDAADLEAQRLEMLKDKKAVEKSNKDEVFKYHIAETHNIPVPPDPRSPPET